MLVNIPIEPLEQRYSKQWNTYFDEWLESYPDKHLTIAPLSPQIFSEIRDGAFLDVLGTTWYKSEQIASIAYGVKLGDIPRDRHVIFLIHDGWFPVEQLAYMRDMLGCHNWKFVGIFHDGTYDKWDLTARNGMYTWGEDLENSWFKIYDKVIVGSEYHRKILILTRHIKYEQIQVIPWKVTVPDIDIKKENIIVFPHRLDVEKQPQLFSKVMNDLFLTDWQVHFTQDVHYTKQQYYKLLAKSRIAVSTSLLEMFGISMVEAVLLGCVPLVPDRLAYKEMYSTPFRYKDENELIYKIKGLIVNPDKYDQQLQNLQSTFRDNSDSFFSSLNYVLEGL